MTITFVRPRYDYGPYSDLYKLIALSGFPLIHFDEMDVTDSSQCYCFSPANGEIPVIEGETRGWPEAKAHIIHLQLEYEHEPAPLHVGVAEKWVCDRWYAQQIGARFVPMGSHPGLNIQPDDCLDKIYDVALLQAPSYHRYQIWGELDALGLSKAPNGWGFERHKALLQSRCMVIVHQHENFPCIAPLRWCLAATYQLPVISETVNNCSPFGGQHFLQAGFDELSRFVQKNLHDSQLLGRSGQMLYQFLCEEMTFRKSIEAAV